jgi:nitroimidazol reductase NimA-like FMN-containing flavoprotein (pyridoxamine 5'-phosphate oxidase superfamily)
MSGERRHAELSREESLRLLATVSLGRIVFTKRALPAVHPVSHIIDGGDLIIRSSAAPTVSSAAGATVGAVVAYQADSIDQESFDGWSVVVTGLAHLVSDPPEVARYQRMLRPWGTGETDCVIRLRPELITGLCLAGGIRPGG